MQLAAGYWLLAENRWIH